MSDSVNAMIVACRDAFTAGDFASVLDLTERLTALRPERPEAWRVRAEAFMALAQAAKAVEPYARALSLIPADLKLRLRLARALAQAGRHAEAATEYQRVFDADPGSLSALHGLLSYQTFSPDDPTLSAVHALARGAPASPGARAFACFLLARICTQAGRDEQGFAFYDQANRLTRESLRDLPELRGPQECLSWWLPRAMGAGLPRVAGGGRSQCPALLITGLPRAGKSLLEHLLCTHPALASGEELGGVHGVVEGLSGSPEARLAALGAMVPDALAQGYVEALAASAHPGARRVVDTAPANLWDLGYLAALHPDVPIILCRRDPLDLGAAIFFKKFRVGHAYSYDQPELGRMLAHAELAIEGWRQALPNPVQVIDYETLVRDPLGTRDAVLTGLGLDPRECAATPAAEVTAPATGALLHASHSPPVWGPVVEEGIGFGTRFAAGLAPMMAAYRQARG